MSQRTIGAEEARTRLPELLERAHHGKATVITKRGQPYAALVPISQAGGALKRPLLLALKGTGAGLWTADAETSVAAMRDEWE
jgi:prevent-host-death family protein